MWLARSRDNGDHWQAWFFHAARERTYYPYLIAQGKGRLAMTWASGFEEDLRLNVAIADAGLEFLLEASSEPQDIEAWQPPQPATRDTAGEYFGVAFLGDGTLGVVSLIQYADGRDGGFTFRRFAKEKKSRLPTK